MCTVCAPHGNAQCAPVCMCVPNTHEQDSIKSPVVFQCTGQKQPTDLPSAAPGKNDAQNQCLTQNQCLIRCLCRNPRRVRANRRKISYSRSDSALGVEQQLAAVRTLLESAKLPPNGTATENASSGFSSGGWSLQIAKSSGSVIDPRTGLCPIPSEPALPARRTLARPPWRTSPSPLEYLVGVDVVTTRHNRHDDPGISVSATIRLFNVSDLAAAQSLALA